ncbi:hypothetical protein [Dactylococcopsis salina]|uniref:hypothetical protein n=1 Tax=Dactylococcopsis salina TaxID=292566 RepID=UPI000306C8D9|nr:hypothetical protein [Dactylococcopsis salina]
MARSLRWLVSLISKIISSLNNLFLSLSQKQQLAITQKAGGITKQLKEAKAHPKQFLFALGKTILLAIFVNIIELGCTAILPVVYMTTLVNHCTTNPALCYTVWTSLYALIRNRFIIYNCVPH